MTFKVCNHGLKYPIYYIKWALLILNLVPLYRMYYAIFMKLHSGREKHLTKVNVRLPRFRLF